MTSNNGPPGALAMLNHQLPQLFDGIEQLLARLLHQNSTQQRAERSHITAQGAILGGIARPRREFG